MKGRKVIYQPDQKKLANRLQIQLMINQKKDLVSHKVVVLKANQF